MLYSKNLITKKGVKEYNTAVRQINALNDENLKILKNQVAIQNNYEKNLETTRRNLSDNAAVLDNRVKYLNALVYETSFMEL